MKKLIGMLTCLVGMSGSVFSQQIFSLKPGAVLSTGAGVVVTLQDMDLRTDGTLLQGPGHGSFVFSGTGTSLLTGSVTPRFDVLQLSKTGGATLSLQQSIQISSQLVFSGGLLDLNGNVIQLQSAAVLTGESETSHVIGLAGGYIQTTVLLNNPVAVNPGNLGAIFTSGQNLGNTLIRRGHFSQLNGQARGNSLTRYYDIMPANDAGLNATLRINYLNAELNGLDKSGLVVWKSPDNSSWASQGFTARDSVANYVELSGISDFSRWTLSSALNPLPLRFGSFAVRCTDGGAALSWTTLQEENTRNFVVERSVDGSGWNRLSSIPASGHSSTERSYAYRDNTSPEGAVLYRIAAFDLDGSFVYTDTDRSSCGAGGAWKTGPNPVSAILWMTIGSSAASAVTIRVIDSRGVVVKIQQEQMVSGNNQYTVNMASLPPAVYFIVAEWNNGAERKTTSVVKTGGN